MSLGWLECLILFMKVCTPTRWHLAFLIYFVVIILSWTLFEFYLLITAITTVCPPISAFVLTCFADEIVEGQFFFDSFREIRAGERGRKDVMKAK